LPNPYVLGVSTCLNPRKLSLTTIRLICIYTQYIVELNNIEYGNSLGLCILGLNMSLKPELLDLAKDHIHVLDLKCHLDRTEVGKLNSLFDRTQSKAVVVTSSCHL